MKLLLPARNGELTSYPLKNVEEDVTPQSQYVFSRVAYAAAHVVVDPARDYEPWSDAPAIDWDRTFAFRSYLYGLGFKVAEAMDTAQRGMGVGWNTAAELIKRSVAHARTIEGADLACGVGTDH